MTTQSICLVPKLEGTGGPSVFQAKLRQGLEQFGIPVHFDPTQADCASILVIGGTSQLLNLLRAKQRGVHIVQRLDGINWLHRLRPTGLRHYLRAERNNWILAFIRRHLADTVVYQSNFAHDWWQTRYHNIRAKSQVIYNGVDLNVFTPRGVEKPPKDSIRVLVIEGSFSGGYDTGLQNAVEFTYRLSQTNQREVKLNIIGQVPEDVIKNIEQTHGNLIHWLGKMPHTKIPIINRQAHMLFSADINAACPNTVIEAFACGLPVVAYATGSLPELIQEDAGRTAPYGSDHWKLEPPNPQALVKAAMEILADQPHFRKAARTHAEKHFSLEKMTEQYLAALQI